MYCVTAKLVFKSYKPLKLEKGMLFLARKNNGYTVYEMEYVPFDIDDYVQLNGYPVEPYIISDANPNISSEEYVIVHPENIGWWDEGEHTDDLRDITVKDYNYILQEFDGYVDVEVGETDEEYEELDDVQIMLYNDKVVLSAPQEEYEEDDDEDTYFFDDDEPYETQLDNTQNNYNDQDEE